MCYQSKKETAESLVDCLDEFLKQKLLTLVEGHVQAAVMTDVKFSTESFCLVTLECVDLPASSFFKNEK